MRVELSYAIFLSSASFALVVPLDTTQLIPRATPCFIVGNVTLPAESQSAADFLEPNVTCDASKTTISDVPDVISGGTSFSSINFAASNQSSLQFALSQFATTEPLAENNLTKFTDESNVYTATEIELRSIGGDLAVKAPKFFINFQIARIQTAQGNPPTDPSQTVEHLLGKVSKNAGPADKAFLPQVSALATVLS